MTRASRFELLGKFFPELTDKDTSDKDKKVAAKMGTLACELILVDQIKMFDKGLKSYGAGALCVRCHDKKQECEYLPIELLEDDMTKAQEAGDSIIYDLLKDGVETIRDTNLEKKAVLMLVDNFRIAFYPVTRDYPAKDIQAMLEEFA